MKKISISSALSGMILLSPFTVFGGTLSIPEDYRVEPAPGSTVESITEITVINTEGDEISNYGNKIKINDEEYSTSPKTDFNRVTFVLTTPITVGGEYAIVIPQGRIIDEYWDDIDEFTFTLYVKDSENPGTGGETSESTIPKGFSVMPAPGSEVESISELKLTYDDDFTELSLAKRSIKINGKDVAVNGYGDFGELTITLLEKITEEGNYGIVIPAGTFELDSLDENEEFSFSLVVKGGSKEDDTDPEPGGEDLAGVPRGFTVSPGENTTITELSVITVVDDNYGDISINSSAKLYIDGKSVEYSAKVEGEYDDTLILTLAESVTEAGSHTIQLPASFFNYMVTTPSKEFGWSVIIEGSEAPGLDFEVTNIPEGVTVLPEANSTVSTLSEISVSIGGWSDLYYADFDYILINGEKVAVKANYGNPLVVDLLTPMTSFGSYWITIPAKSIMNDYGRYVEDPIQFKVMIDPSTGVDNIIATEHGNIEIYTIEGIKVDDMRSGSIYILRDKCTGITKRVKK